jgi:hypothetical protein
LPKPPLLIAPFDASDAATDSADELLVTEVVVFLDVLENSPAAPDNKEYALVTFSVTEYARSYAEQVVTY